ncbi:hypothetical protein GGF31_008586 [Allomyces arbusculus]|nr:hypothetical protein GGF31_008586 [Allomyces arbusculus]
MSARTRGGGQRRRSQLPATALAVAAAVLLLLAVLAPVTTTNAAPAPAPADPTFAPPLLPPVPSRSPAPTSAVPAPTEVAPAPTAAPTQADPPPVATTATPPASRDLIPTASPSPAPVPTNNFGVRPSPQPTVAPTPQPQPTAAPTAAPSPTPAPSTASSNQRAVSPPAGARQASDVPISGDGTVLAVQDASPSAASNNNQPPSSAAGHSPSDAPAASPAVPAPNAGDSTQTDSNNGATNGVTDAVATAPTGSGASSSSASTASVVTPIVTTLGVIGAVGAVAAVAYQRVRRRRSAATAIDTASVYHPRTSPHTSNAPSSTTPSLVNALSGAGTAPRRSYKLSLYGPPASASAMFASGAGPATPLPPLTPKSTQAIFQAPWYRAQPGADAADDDDDSTRAMPYARARIPDSEHRSASKGYAPPPAIAIPIPVLSAAPAALSPVPVSPMSPMSQRVPRLVNLDAARDRRMAESMWFDGDAEGDEDETRSWAGSARRRRSSAGTSPTVPMGPPAWAAVAEAARGLAEVDDDNESALSLTAALATLPAAAASTPNPAAAAPAAEPGTTNSPRESLTPSENAPSSTFSFHPAGAAAASPPVLASPAPAIAGPAPRAGARRVAIPYAPSLDDELLLNLDDLVVVEHVYLDNWAVGHNLSTGQSGAFPVICLQ